jgi:hypothetical protein
MDAASSFIESTTTGGAWRSSNRTFISMQMSADAWADMKNATSASGATRPRTLRRRMVLRELGTIE